MKNFSAVAAIIFLFAIGAASQTTNGLSDAEIQGRSLARQLYAAQPATNLNQNGAFDIRDDKGNYSKIPFRFQIFITSNRWSATYETISESNQVSLVVIHESRKPNQYELFNGLPLALALPKFLAGNQTMVSFAGSDFWVCDLGLEFFHWPEQKILPNPTNLKRGRSYTLLESINPNPSTNGYSRVLSYIDKETGGILEAEAYDSHGKLLKEFYPKDFKKVDGQWQLQSMEMDNVQTGSRSWIKFDVKKQ